MATLLTHEQLPRLHNLTAEVQKLCRGQLRTYLDALAPLFRPRRVLGNHMEGAGKESVIGADENFAQLRELYFKACGRPFDLRKELPSPLDSVGTQIALYEWEYLYDVRAGEVRTVTVVSPLTWVLAYPSTYTLSMIRHVVAGRQDRDAEGVRSFVLRACLMDLLFQKLPDLAAVFEGLRYRVEIRKAALLGDLPIVTISAPIPTVRPADDLLLRATGLSGRSAFVEVIDDYHAAHIPDPLQAQILKVLDEGSGTTGA
ncbi:MAG: hypothetical protein J2P13_10660 [Acidobacteria bacterium]|nr:hypothetical protein [Acidobacteriota bacterium]